MNSPPHPGLQAGARVALQRSPILRLAQEKCTPKALDRCLRHRFWVGFSAWQRQRPHRWLKNGGRAIAHFSVWTEGQISHRRMKMARIKTTDRAHWICVGLGALKIAGGSSARKQRRDWSAALATPPAS